MKTFILLIPPFTQTVFFLAALLFIVRLAVSPFSPKVSQQIWKHPVIHSLWGCFAVIGVLMIFYAVNPAIWPPNFVARREQRQQILQRIESVGGWAALKRDCDALAAKCQIDQEDFRWLRGRTNSLPPAIAALKPKQVDYYPPNALKQSAGNSSFGSNAVVRISIFGTHATGGRDQPWLGLDVVCEPGIATYSPRILRSTTPLRYWHYRKVADNIYEFY